MAPEDPTNVATEMVDLLQSPELRQMTREIIDNPIVRQKIDAAGAAMRVGEQGWLIRKVVGAGAIEEKGEILTIVKHTEGPGAGQAFGVEDSMILSWDPWIPYRGDTVHHGASGWSVEEADREIGMRVILPLTGKLIDVVVDGKDRPVGLVEVDDRFGVGGPQSFTINALLDGLVPAPFLLSEEEKREMFKRLHPEVELADDDRVEMRAGKEGRDLRDDQGRTAEEAGFDLRGAYIDTDGSWSASPAEDEQVKDGPAIVSGDDA